MGFKKSEDRVDESDFSDILDVLGGGTSTWHEFIVPNLTVARSSPRSFQVLTVRKFNETTGYGTDTPGVTYKQTGAIIMQQWGREGSTFLSAALHECVHLVSDPAKQGVQDSTALGILGVGLLEGLVEVVTQDVLKDQKIPLPKDTMRGHPERVAIVRELLQTMSVVLLARALFRGDGAQLIAVMEATYSRAGWQNIKNLANAKRKDLAHNVMTTSRRQQEDANKRAIDAAIKAITPPPVPPATP